jgi:protein-S-isoprenylcysteine O-methyltransferase
LRGWGASRRHHGGGVEALDMSFGRALKALALGALIYLLPLLVVRDRLALPGPWMALTAMAIIQLSQPAISAGTMVRDRTDRGSALGIYLAMIVGQLAAVFEFGFRNPSPPTFFAAWTGAGFIAIVAGLSLRLWAIRTLGRFFTSTVMVQDGQTVVRTGPYRVLRHPSYTGALLVSLGVTIVLASPLGAALTLVLCTPAYLYRIAVEERTLVKELCDPYRAYRQDTWRLIPGIF